MCSLWVKNLLNGNMTASQYRGQMYIFDTIIFNVSLFESYTGRPIDYSFLVSLLCFASALEFPAAAYKLKH